MARQELIAEILEKAASIPASVEKKQLLSELLNKLTIAEISELTLTLYPNISRHLEDVVMLIYKAADIPIDIPLSEIDPEITARMDKTVPLFEELASLIKLIVNELKGVE